MQVNHRFFGPLDTEGLDSLIEDLRSGRLADTVPAHGTLSRVQRKVGLPAAASKLADSQASNSAPGPISGPVPA